MNEVTKRGFPRAASYEIFECGDSNCGPHIIPLDAQGVPMCEVVLSPGQTLSLIQNLQGLLYRKATEKEGRP